MSWWSLAGAPQRSLARLRRVTLGTRLLVVLVGVAAASTVLTVMLQDSSLSADLRQAAQRRLENAAAMAAQLLDGHLVAQLERYRAISTTPQFLANLESGHQATLSHYANELTSAQGAHAVMFLDRDGRDLAGAGNPGLRAAARGDPSLVRRGVAVSTLVASDGAPYSVVSVPLRDGASFRGSLVAVEPIDGDELTHWSDLCRARIAFGEPKDGDHLSLPVRQIGDLRLRAFSSFDAEGEALANSRWNLITGGFLGLALASIASVFLSRSLVRPIRAIQAAAERIGEGDLQSRLDDTRRDEVGDVARAFNLMLDRLDQNISRRLRIEHQISHLAYHDTLTGLGNRRLLKERLGLALVRARRQQSGVGVIYLDLDRFKDVNDLLGYAAGDELLMEVADRLNSCVRATGLDGDPGDVTLLARLGGDEFSIMLTDLEDRDQIAGLAARILGALDEPFALGGQDVTLSASIGIALSPDDAEDVETLLRDSDMAMFHAKNQGGRSYEFYADSMQEIAAKRLALERRLQRALENDEFELFYQPKVDLLTNQVTGVEALLRWKGDDLGEVGPEEFVPMAEETGAIVPIGEWVLRTAMQQSLQWQREGLRVRIAVNVSVRQIEDREDFVQKVAGLLEETRLDPQLLDLEITEGVLLKDEDAAIALFEKLRDMGVGLSLDDFGTGYSSLSYLRRLPIDTLKIDRSFIQGAHSNPEDAALVGSIIAMAKVLDLRVIAEGVETRRQRQLLEELGCDEIQGFLVSSPLDASATAQLLLKQPRPKRKRAGATSAPALS